MNDDDRIDSSIFFNRINQINIKNRANRINQNLKIFINHHQRSSKKSRPQSSLSKSIFDSEYHSDNKSHRHGLSDDEQEIASLKIRTSV